MGEVPDGVLEAIWAQAAKMFSADCFAIALCGADPNRISYEMVVERGVRQSCQTRELGDGLSDLVVRTRNPLLVRNFELEKGCLPLSWMGSPMIAGDGVLGLLTVQSFRSEAFDARDLAVLGILANWAASAVESARAHRSQMEEAEIQTQRHHRQASEAIALRELNQVKSRLISTISHELRTPLSFVQAGSELLMQRLFEPDQLRQVAGLVTQGSRRLAEVVDDIIEFSDLQSGSVSLYLQLTDPVATVRDAIEDATAGAQDHRVVLEAAEGLPTVKVDNAKLKSVAARLVSNGLKFSQEPSVVQVRVGIAAQKLRIEVSDSGFGIRPEELDRVFEPFFRGEVSQARCIPGTGLGLSIVKQVVDAMGGEVSLRSRVDEGTTVVVTLPFDMSERLTRLG